MRSEWELFGTKAFILALSPVARIRGLADLLTVQYDSFAFEGDWRSLFFLIVDNIVLVMLMALMFQTKGTTKSTMGRQW